MQDASIAGTVKGPRIIAAIIDYGLYTIVAVGSIFILILGPASDESTIELISSNFWHLIFFPGRTWIDVSSSLDISYTLQGMSVLILLITGFLYFSFLPYKWNGQTLGKKLTHIKVVDETLKNPTLLQHILRSVRVYNLYFTVALLPLILVIGGLFWLSGSGMMALSLSMLLLLGAVSVGTALMYVSGVMLVVRRDAKGLHDMIAKTMVVPENNPFEDEE